MVLYVTFLSLLQAGRLFSGAAFVREAEKMNFLGILQERISKRLEVPQQTISGYLPNMVTLPFSVNADLSMGYIVPQVAEKYGWPD